MPRKRATAPSSFIDPRRRPAFKRMIALIRSLPIFLPLLWLQTAQQFYPGFASSAAQSQRQGGAVCARRIGIIGCVAEGAVGQERGDGLVEQIAAPDAAAEPAIVRCPGE